LLEVFPAKAAMAATLVLMLVAVAVLEA